MGRSLASPEERGTRSAVRVGAETRAPISAVLLAAITTAPTEGLGLAWPLEPGEWLGLLASYLLGSVPFGFLMAKSLRGVDLRTVGSGNIGATNAMRVLGKPLGLVAFLLDFGKGLVPVLVFAPLCARSGAAAVDLGVLCGGAAVCGHVWPVFLRFRGGKGVATGCGALLGLDPLVVLVGTGVWLVTLVATRYAGLASMAMGVALPLAAWWRAATGGGVWSVVAGASALTLLILVRHRSNMARMWAGTEPKIGAKRASGEVTP